MFLPLSGLQVLSDLGDRRPRIAAAIFVLILLGFIMAVVLAVRDAPAVQAENERWWSEALACRQQGKSYEYFGRQHGYVCVPPRF